MSQLPPETAQSAAKRAELYSTWPNREQAAALLGFSSAQIDSGRRSRRLLAVWVHELGEYRFPTFQFYRGGLFEKMPHLLALLPDSSGSGWEWVEWFISHRSLLEGGSPASYLLGGRFDDVLEAAEKESLDEDRW